MPFRNRFRLSSNCPEKNRGQFINGTNNSPGIRGSPEIDSLPPWGAGHTVQRIATSVEDGQLTLFHVGRRSPAVVNPRTNFAGAGGKHGTCLCSPSAADVLRRNQPRNFAGFTAGEFRVRAIVTDHGIEITTMTSASTTLLGECAVGSAQIARCARGLRSTAFVAHQNHCGPAAWFLNGVKALFRKAASPTASTSSITHDYARDAGGPPRPKMPSLLPYRSNKR